MCVTDLDENKVFGIGKIRSFIKEHPTYWYKIGKTSDPASRKEDHERDGFTYFSILRRVKTLEEMNKLETDLISFFRGKAKCLNKESGGEGRIGEGTDYCVYLIAKE